MDVVRITLKDPVSVYVVNMVHTIIDPCGVHSNNDGCGDGNIYKVTFKIPVGESEKRCAKLNEFLDSINYKGIFKFEVNGVEL